MTKSLIKTHSEKLKIQRQDSSQLWRLSPSEWDFCRNKGNCSVNVQPCKNLHGRAGAYGLPTCVNGRI